MSGYLCFKKSMGGIYYIERDRRGTAVCQCLSLWRVDSAAFVTLQWLESGASML